MVMMLLVVAAVLVVAGALLAAADVQNPFAGNAAAISEGENLYDRNCAECHLDGTGGSGPNLVDDTWKFGGSDADVFTSVSKGRPGGMPSWEGELSVEDIWKVIAYVRSLRR